MNVAQLKVHCAALPGAQAQDHGPPASILVYRVGGRRFAHFKTSAPQRWRFSVRVPPERFLELTDQPGIQPARWLARHHWITVVDVRRMPEAELAALVDGSYRHALSRLTRAQRARIADGGE